MKRLKRALIVDDNKTNLMVLKELIEMIGVPQVIAETNPVYALNILKKTPVDCVLIDQNMPQMSGLALYAELKQSMPSIPATFMVSAIDDSELRVKAREAGMEGFISKPFRYEIIERMLRDLDERL
ncbi:MULTISPECIES: response regulator [unclassified Idiomarina]|jgi:CheY-like chemotaxis protein|uniref:response regulator n=1 Tax=unclassified Idiomarina TaxID=2614829 RepID=UPI0008F7F2F1|nr:MULTISPECIES: response regulator [unclassified Idiomarina]MAD52486.1 response regulator [Idiomarinaceae bacterium]MEC7643318.1 response regulator [Pseudomonadota bacterium]MEC9318774.1 response regulator [Pseudomonadota bacterium]NQZ03442.1 response regulator [Idiomarina sp.]OIM99427.1 hypothetical protein BFR57_02325 [Idiomarina sp. MD25a]|tara:strand:- start:9099 stop:9476 length:378 start_codon:yes stop_codon:yes gene_type:complete